MIDADDPVSDETQADPVVTGDCVTGRGGLDSIRARAESLQCTDCSLHDLCLVEGLNRAELEQLSGMVSIRRRVRRGAALFRAGDPFDALFPVRSGSLKTRVLAADGREQIVGFPLPGDILGFDAISSGRFNRDAVALEDSEVCVIPFVELEALGRRFPPLQSRINRIISREIVRDQGLMVLLGTMRAEQRVGAFVLRLSERFAQRGFSSSRFVLRMTREEIGSYLGMKLETVSRMLSKMQDAGIVSVDQRELTILDPDGLRRVSGLA